MAEATIFKFETKAVPDETLTVVDFRGENRLSEPYRYVINLRSEDPDIDFEEMLSDRCTFKIVTESETYPVHGILSEFEELEQLGGYSHYRAVLVPQLWKLSLYRTNEVFLDETIPEILEKVLQEGGLSGLDYELSLQGEYEAWEYLCQYGETHLDFIYRLMEREGIYFYFEQGDEAEKLILTDTLQHHETIDNDGLDFAPATGLDYQAEDHIRSLISRSKRMPEKVVLKDFNYDKPSLDVTGEATVDDRGVGEVYVYGENFLTPEDGNRLAEIRAEEIYCSKTRFHGESRVPRLKTGYTFDLNNHFRDSFNQTYLVIGMETEGTNTEFLTTLDGSDDRAGEGGYINTFEAIASDVQFRPERNTVKPRFYGTISAKIDAEGEGKYAEVDDEGRYKVVLPFDRVLRNEGKASHWVRMQQPYAGSDEGMHFPLRKGTEVLLTFIDGDPDRPVISGAVANGSNPNVVNSGNQTNNIIKTASGNLIEMEDQEDTNRIKLSTGDDKTYMHLGSPNHAGDGWVVLTTGMERKEVSGGRRLTWKTASSVLTSAQSEVSADGTVLADTNNTTKSDGTTTEVALNPVNDLSLFTFNAMSRSSETWTYTPLTKTNEIAGTRLIDREQGIKYSWRSGRDIGFHVGRSLDVYHSKESAAWSDLQGLLNNVYKSSTSATPGYQPKKPWKFGTKNEAGSFAEIVEGARVELREHDTVTAQNGNIYDFGGYWNYNLGNSYAEDHIKQDATLNQQHTGLEKLNGEGTKIRDVMSGPDSAGTMAIKGPKGKVNTTAGDCWVQKSFGDSYEYTVGVGGTKAANQIEISWVNSESHSGGNSYEYSYGGEHQETSYDGTGTKRSYERKGSGTYEEMTWNKQGAVIHHEIGNSNFGKSSLVFDFGHSNEISFNAAATSKLSINTGLSIDISASASLETTIAAKAAMTLDLTASGGFKMEGEVGYGFMMELVGPDKFVMQGPGMALTTKKAFEAEIQSLMLEDMRIQMQNQNIELKNGTLVVDNEPIEMDVGMEFNL